MKRKDGEPRSDYDNELDGIILDVIFDKKTINAERMRHIINKRFSRKLGWVTIKRHLDNLLEKNKIKIFYESEAEKKKVRVYKIK